MRVLHILAAMAAAAFVAAPATAQMKLQAPGQSQGQPAALSGTVTRVTVEQLAKVLQDAGYRAEIVPGSKEPYIRTGLSGRRAAIYMYDCKEGTCGAYQFVVSYAKNSKYTLAYVNEWNKTKRYTKAYLDKDNDVSFEWDIDLDGGVTPEFLKTTVSSFETYIGLFDKFSM